MRRWQRGPGGLHGGGLRCTLGRREVVGVKLGGKVATSPATPTCILICSLGPLQPVLCGRSPHAPPPTHLPVPLPSRPAFPPAVLPPIPTFPSAEQG